MDLNLFGKKRVFYLHERESWSSYWSQRIDEWQNAGSDVYVSGCNASLWDRVSSAPASPAGQSNSWTYINPGHAIRQKGYIKSISLDIFYLYNGGDTWEFKLFTWNGTAYQCKASQAFNPVGSAVVSNWQTFTLNPPILADEGDVPGVFIPLKNAMYPGPDPVNTDKYLPSCGKMVGNVAVDGLFTFEQAFDDPYQFIKIKCNSHRPYAAFIGDSIFGGGNGYGYPPDGREWHTDQENAGIGDVHSPGGNSDGDINLQVAYRLSTRMPSNFRYQNFAKGGSTTPSMEARKTNAILSDPKSIFIHCGFNDIANAITWDTAKTHLDIIKAALSEGTEVYMDEILPTPDDTKASADTKVARNAQIKTYCEDSGWILVECYQPLGSWDTDHYVLNPLYSNGDNVHLSLAGVDKLAEIIYNTIRAQPRT